MEAIGVVLHCFGLVGSEGCLGGKELEEIDGKGVWVSDSGSVLR